MATKATAKAKVKAAFIFGKPKRNQDLIFFGILNRLEFGSDDEDETLDS